MNTEKTITQSQEELRERLAEAFYARHPAIRFVYAGGTNKARTVNQVVPWEEASPAEREDDYEFADIAISLLRHAEGVGWRPIETAPKDGTLIDVWTSVGRRTSVYWGRKDHFGRSPWGPVDWQNCGEHNAPTHWMPFPTPPQEGGGEEDLSARDQEGDHDA